MNAEPAASELHQAFADPFLSCVNSTTTLGIAATMVLIDSTLVRSRTGALLSRRFDHSLQLSSPCGVVDGPSAYLTRDGESTVKNRTETRMTAPIFRAK
jgi:hypothetical protein